MYGDFEYDYPRDKTSFKRLVASLGYVFYTDTQWSFEPSALFQISELTREKALDTNFKAYYKLNYGRLWAGISFRNSFEGAQYVDVSTGELKEQTLQLITPLFGIDFKDAGFPDEVAMPEKVELRQWASIIKHADHFLGCDSVGQHLAYSVGTPASVVFGATYPENTSYAKTDKFNIIDLGQMVREYDPIRITMDERISRKQEQIMTMTPEIEDYVVAAVNGDPIED